MKKHKLPISMKKKSQLKNAALYTNLTQNNQESQHTRVGRESAGYTDGQ